MALYGMEVQTRKGCQSFDSPLCCQLPTGQGRHEVGDQAAPPV